MASSCGRGGQRWVLGKGSSPKGWLEQAGSVPQLGLCHGPKSEGIQEVFGQHS